MYIWGGIICPHHHLTPQASVSLLKSTPHNSINYLVRTKAGRAISRYSVTTITTVSG